MAGLGPNWPAPLQPGDRLLAIAPSGALPERDRLEAGLALWRQRGYTVDLAEHVFERHGYLAGTDAQRAVDLQRGLGDQRYAGILCVRGGWGGARLLEHQPWPTQASPKWLVGFSDITSLLWAQVTQGQGGGVHGPLLITLDSEPPEYRQRLFDLLEGRPLPPLSGDPWVTGTARGPLLPCNLTVATHLLGTALLPDLRGAILAIEDVGEAPYRIDRMLTHWRMSGALDQVAGIALGSFDLCEPDPERPGFTLEAVMRDRLTDLGIPVLAHLPFGHAVGNAALPVGAIATLQQGQLHIGSGN